MLQAKSGSMGKNNSHNTMLNQYAQSWVFDSDTVGSSQSETPYNKLPPQLNGSKTVVLKRKERPSVCEQPVVLVEDTTGDRQLPVMTSFSRTPSPVPGTSDSSSLSSSSPAIYECLERLTEPSVYRAHLDTAIGTNIDRLSPSAPLRPHSAIVTEQVHYASLMMELNKTIETKFPQRTSQRLSSRDESACKSSVSDVDFSKELDAALQLIQDLESPNTSGTSADTSRSMFVEKDPRESLSAGKQCVIHNEGNKTIISLVPQKKYTSIVTIVPNSPNPSDQTKEYTFGAHCSTPNTKDLVDVKMQNYPVTIKQTIDSKSVMEKGGCSLADSKMPITIPSPPQNGNVRLLSKHKSFKDCSAVEFNNNNIHKSCKNVLARSISLTEKDTNSLLQSRWSLKTLLKRKPSQLKLTPELESAILKSESLAHLTELELIARYDQNKLLQRVRS